MGLPTSTDHVRETGGRRPRLAVLTALGTLAAFVLSLVIVLVAALRDTDLVATEAGQRSVDLGWPWAWIHQDQSSVDPSLPSQMRFESPWENPTSLSAVILIENVFVVFAVLAVGGLLGGALAVVLARRVRPTQA